MQFRPLRRWTFVDRTRLLGPQAHPAWLALGVMAPFTDDERRVYFTGRDSAGRGSIGACALERDGDTLRLGAIGAPLLTPGAPGGFDETGVVGSCTVAHGGSILLYYTGVVHGVRPISSAAIGVAISDDGGATFRRTRTPLLDGDEEHHFVAASPCVRIERGRWRMWYAGGSVLERTPARLRYHYSICYAESPDGLRWQRHDAPCIVPAAASEYAITRPCVVRDDGRYRMWFCARGTHYRLGYAESDDGLRWERDDRCAGLLPSGRDWDGEEIAYPWLREAAATRYLLYTGNGYGRSGFGYARAAA